MRPKYPLLVGALLLGLLGAALARNVITNVPGGGVPPSACVVQFAGPVVYEEPVYFCGPHP